MSQLNAGINRLTRMMEGLPRQLSQSLRPRSDYPNPVHTYMGETHPRQPVPKAAVRPSPEAVKARSAARTALKKGTVNRQTEVKKTTAITPPHTRDAQMQNVMRSVNRQRRINLSTRQQSQKRSEQKIDLGKPAARRKPTQMVQKQNAARPGRSAQAGSSGGDSQMVALLQSMNGHLQQIVGLLGGRAQGGSKSGGLSDVIQPTASPSVKLSLRQGGAGGGNANARAWNSVSMKGLRAAGQAIGGFI